MENVVDLDILRPEKKFVKLGGKEFDVSYIPVAITFEIDELIERLGLFDREKLLKDKKTMREAFNLSVELCATFAHFWNSEITSDWIKENCNVAQVRAFTDAIKDALIRSYAGVEAYGKN